MNITDLRLGLLDRGYIPLPITSPDASCKDAGKAPHLSKWQTIEVTPDAIRGWGLARCTESNTGLRCGCLLGMDIDVRDDALVARLLALANDTIGASPLMRIGQAPKTMLAYRAETPFTKIKTPRLLMPDGQYALIECLATGQQFVGFGIHPGTRQPYLWPHASPLDVPVSELPAVTEAQVRAFVAEAEHALRAAGGHPETKDEPQGTTPRTRAHRPAAAWPPPTHQDVAAALRAVPNNVDWDLWVKVGAAIFDALADDGEDLFIAWSAQSPNDDPEATRRKWRSYRTSPMTTTASTLFWLARQNGWRPACTTKSNGAHTTSDPWPDAAAEETAELAEPPIPSDPAPPDHPDDPQQAEIHRLAELPELEFERIRKTEAERLGLGIGILGRAVARARRAAKAEAKAAKAEAKAEAKARDAKAKADEKARKTAEARARLDAQKAPPLTDDEDDPLHGWTPPSSNTLPEIIVAPGERPAIADAALAAMAAARVPFYQRDRDIVRVCLIKSKLSDGTMVCVPAISVVTVPMLMRALGLCATWYAYTKEFDLVQIDPPSDLGDHILGMIGEWPFPPLRGVIATQTMRYDGSLLTKPGYDRATGLVLFNPPPMPPIPDQPTKNDALEALALLRNLIDEVAFADDDNVSLSGAISMLMTPVLRGMMAVAPMHVVTKPSAGSGGSYMQDITAAIALGERCPVLSLTQRNDEENAKVLSSAALTGQPLIAIDNFTGTLMGDFLCQLIERPMPQVRILGRSQVVTIANNHCVMANGNNVTTGSDAIRRTVHISLDANVENPESRTFTHNPVAEVLADRGRYVAAILIIARAYRVAGVPGKLPPRLSFEDWSNNVRSALVWLGWPDPDESIKAVRAADPITAKLHAVIAAWATDLRADRSYLTSELVAEAAEYLPSSSDRIRPAMWDALFAIAGTKTGHLDVLRLGQWLQAHLNRISGGYKLLVDRTNKARPRWRLEPR